MAFSLASRVRTYSTCRSKYSCLGPEARRKLPTLRAVHEQSSTDATIVCSSSMTHFLSAHRFILRMVRSDPTCRCRAKKGKCNRRPSAIHPLLPYPTRLNLLSHDTACSAPLVLLNLQTFSTMAEFSSSSSLPPSHPAVLASIDQYMTKRCREASGECTYDDLAAAMVNPLSTTKSFFARILALFTCGGLGERRLLPWRALGFDRATLWSGIKARTSVLD